MNDPRSQLDALLCETPAVARARECSAFHELAEGRQSIVIFGAGRLGRKILQGLSDSDLKPIAFADSNPRLWGTVADGLAVFSPQEAADKFSADATFVAAIWHPSRSPLMSGLLAQLRSLSCRAAAFTTLFWRYPSRFLPYFFWDLPSNLLRQSADIAAAFELLDDDVSRQTFVALLQLRLQADFDCLGTPAPGEQYFPGLFTMTTEESFVDCGAFTGDTIQSFISQTDNAFRKVIAFEADPSVLPSLETFMSDLGSRAVLHKAAVGARNGTVHFLGDGIGGGCVTGAAGVEVPCLRLDDVLAREHASFIKMDIEGAELQALEGAQRTIRRDRPVVAVCGYHTPDHLWRVPLSLKTMAPASSFFLRSHCADGLDAVYYSVPPERGVHTVTTALLTTAAPKDSRDTAQGSLT
jgi:FkbM family methyltransferase